MVFLYRTSYPPIEYRARYLSCAFLFRALCFIISYICPIIVCVFYVVQNSAITIDSERPFVVPGNILQILIVAANGTHRVYPPTGSTPPQAGHLAVIPKYDGDQRLSEWTVSFAVIDESAGDVRAVSVAFAFTANLYTWTSATIPSIATYTQTFPHETNTVSAVGDLRFDQNEVIDFRGSFQKVGVEVPPVVSLSDILTNEDSLSALFYVDWEPTVAYYGKWTNFTMTLRVRVHDVEVIHSIPLVASIESVLILFLSMFLLAALVVKTVQGFVFRRGIIKAWAIQQYSAPVHEKIH